MVLYENRRSFADVFTQSSTDTLVSLAENGHFAIVLWFAPQWCAYTRNDKRTTDSKHRPMYLGAKDSSVCRALDC